MSENKHLHIRVLICHLNYDSVNVWWNDVLLRSSRQSSLLRNLWVMSPVARTEYGQASSDSRPLISSWKLSASLGPAMDASTPNMSLHANLHAHHMLNNTHSYGKLRNSKSSMALWGIFFTAAISVSYCLWHEHSPPACSTTWAPRQSRRRAWCILEKLRLPWRHTPKHHPLKGGLGTYSNRHPNHLRQPWRAAVATTDVCAFVCPNLDKNEIMSNKCSGTCIKLHA